MSNRFVDLHCHSTASDGTLSPTQVIALAAENSLSALSLTDHDTIAGVAEAAAAARSADIDFLPGIEISAECPVPNGTLHILGYGVSPHSPVLHELTRKLIEGRDNRNPRIVAKLNEMGVSVTMEEWQAEAKGAVLGRPQLAAILLRKGYVSSIKNAFEKYLAQGSPAYADKERLTARQAFSMIRESGGIPVLAHAAQLKTTNDAQLRQTVKDLVDQGLAGIEVYHSDHDQAWIDKCLALSSEFKLVQTGGSDFHGSNKHNITLGVAAGKRIARELFDQLVAAVARQRHTPPVAQGSAP